MSGSGLKVTLARGLAGRLFTVLGMVLAVELDQAKKKGRLAGKTPETRYDFFDSRITHGKAHPRILQKYKGLNRLMDFIPLDWHSHVHMMLHRLYRDEAVLVRSFDLDGPPADPMAIQLDQGDLHEKGESVCVVRFGGDRMIVYKPRSMGSDSLIERLFRELNEQFGWEVFRLPRHLNMGNYGWQEWIYDTACQNKKEVALFYQRQGINLALVYLLGGIDFHSENMVASGPYPVPVDLETIMQPLLNGKHDLSRTGIAPVSGRSFDYSALGFDPNADNRIEANVWKDWGKDTLHLMPEQVLYKGKHCTPVLDDTPIPVTEFRNTVCDEFESALMTLAHAFRNNEYLEELLCKIPIRFIHRPSQLYHEILTASFHPENLKSPKKRRSFIQTQLERLVIPTPPRLLNHEISVLEAGYLPTCHTRADSTDLWFEGDKINRFFSQTTIIQFRERVARCLHSTRPLTDELRKSLAG